MKILFVGMIGSIHVARWIEQVVDQGWEIHLFAADDSRLHPEIRGVTVHDLQAQESENGLRVRGWPWPFTRAPLAARRWFFRDTEYWRAAALARVIRRVQPDIIHSLEIQHAGYLALAVRESAPRPFPKWIASNWGSDIYLFGQLHEHRARIRAVLAACDWYGCECERDVHLARRLGLKAPVLPVLPNAGGFDLDRIPELRTEAPPSQRKLVVLKGYQGWAGRALVGLTALENCADVLADHRVAIFSPAPEVEFAARLASERTGLDIECVPSSTHEHILRLHGRARVSIGLSIGDAISTSLLEAMTMGSFPIQSDTSCAAEWIQDGETGFLVPPDDVPTIEDRLRRALTDDAFVDEAQRRNDLTVQSRLDRKQIRPRVIQSYQEIHASDGANR